MERLIELFINTEDGEFYDRGGLLAAYDPAINAGELVRLTVQLCAGVPAFNSDGALLNPDTTFAGTLAAAETIIDNNFNWYDKGTLLENLTTGTAISELSVASEASPRQLGAVRLNAGTVVNFCGWTATEGGYRLTLADNEFNPAQFTPAADFAQGAAVEVLEQPIIVSAQNDDSGRATGLFTGLLDAANPVYESMIEGHEDIPNCRIEFSIYQDGRAVFRARRYFDCLGAMAMNKGAAYVHSDSWREADSRYIKLVDWQAPPEYQFSEDGTAWHDQQQDADLYYHERRPGGQWGTAVKMKIGQTGAAAGFGAPTVAVESLPAGSAATASVTASGDNTAKVFSFSFGIPKGTDGQNGADGVSSYTYVAYASDASGTGFSLTPSNALKFRAEIHTTTAIETPDADDFAGATWVKYIGDDGTGTGDMTKSVYDTNNDGIVDHAATADTVGATTAAQVADAVGKAHTHANKATLDKLAEADGKLTFDGAEIGGASNWNDITGKPETFPPSAHNHAITDVTGLEDALQNAGTVKSVNGQLPDESGNVTVETGGAVDESRLLPENPANGDIPCFDATATIGGGNDQNTVALLHLTEVPPVDTAAGNLAPLLITTSGTAAQNMETPKFGSSYVKLTSGCIKIPVDDAGFASNNWAASVWFRPLNTNTTFVMGHDADNGYNGGGWNVQWGSEGFKLFNREGTSSPWKSAAANAWYWLVVVKNGDRLLFYVNGAKIGELADVPVNCVMTLGAMSTRTDYYPITGDVQEFRLQYLDSGELPGWTGTSIAVPDAPYSKPQTVGEWSKLNKSELVKSVNGQTPDSSGAVTIPAATASAAGLMAAADKATLTGLTARGIYPELYNVVDPIDFNQLTTQGFYFIGGGADHINYPGTNAKLPGTLTVLRRGNYLTQTFSAVGEVGTSVWERNMYRANIGNAFTATNWHRLISDTDIVSITTAGLMPGDLYSKLINRFTGNPTMPVQDRIDLNTLTETGFYTCGLCTNAPKDNQYFYLMVVRYGTVNVFNWQLACDINTGIMYSRRSRSNASDGTIWDSWQQLLTNADITESKNRPGYFKLPGGTIVQWGAALNITADGTTSVTLPIAFPNSAFVATTTATGSGLIASTAFDGNSKLNVIVKGYPGSGNFTIYWLAIGY